MKKNLLILSLLGLCTFMCGCDNTDTPANGNIIVEPNVEENVQCSEDECLDDMIDELDIEEVNVAQKLEGEDQITVSQGDWKD